MQLFREYPKYKWTLAALDIFTLNLSFIVSVILVSLAKGTSFEAYIPELRLSEEWKLFAIYALLIIPYFQYANLYKIQNIFRPGTHFMLIFKSNIVVVVGFILFQFALKDIQISSRVFYGVLFIVLNLFLFFFRLPFVDIIKKNPRLRDNVVIIGSGTRALDLMNILAKKTRFINATGYLRYRENIDKMHEYKCLGYVRDVLDYNEKNKVKNFILAVDNLSRKDFFEIFEFFQQNKLTLSVSSDYLKVLQDNLDVDYFEDYGLIRFSAAADYKFSQKIKRFFDIIFAAIGILLLSPIMLVVMLMVKFSSPGPIIYKQIRVGKKGRPFYFYKFRSMYVNSDKDEDRAQAMEDFIKGNNGESDEGTKVVNKSNITRVGAFIRKYSLDELPQLFNVLIGNMSLVGPRPCVMGEWKTYDDWQKHRLNTIPGCTGLWQISGRSKVDFEESVLMDLYYNQNYTPWLDIQIILKTIPVMLLGKGGG